MSSIRRMRDAAAMVATAPALIEQADQLATEAQLFAAAQQTVFTVGAVAPTSVGSGATRAAGGGGPVHIERFGPA